MNMIWWRLFLFKMTQFQFDLLDNHKLDFESCYLEQDLLGFSFNEDSLQRYCSLPLFYYVNISCSASCFDWFTFCSAIRFHRTLKHYHSKFFRQNMPLLVPTPWIIPRCVVYEYTCPGCFQHYTGKTEWTLFKRMKEHSIKFTSHYQNIWMHGRRS